MRQQRGGHINSRKKIISGARQQDNPARGADQVGLDRYRLRVAFLLGVARRGDPFAKVARMVAIESLGDSLGERSLLRIPRNHRPPGNGLEDDPMRADREAQCQDHNGARDV